MARFRRGARDAGPGQELYLPGLEPDETQMFMADLAAVLDPRGVSWGVFDGALRLEGSPTEYGLTNVAQQWLETMPTARRALVAERLAGVGGQGHAPRPTAGRAPGRPPRPTAGRAPGRPPGPTAGPVAAGALPGLTRPQLWPMAGLEELGDDVVAREVTEDLAAVLSLDLPDSVHIVAPKDIADSGLGEEELWERALAQLDDGEPIERTLLDDDELVVVLVSDSHFLASRLLALEELVGAVPPHGVLIGVPHRHMFVVHAIYDATVLEAMNLMAPFVVQHFEEGPGSLSPDLYWWHDGEIERLVVDDDEGSITPPDGFVALLEGLTEE